LTNGVFGLGEAPPLYNALHSAAQIGSGVESVALTAVNPLPTSWPAMVYANVTTDANVVLPGNADLTGNFVEEGSVDCFWDASKLPAPLAPVGGPVTQPLIAQQDAFKAHTGVGTTPTLSWQPPALGTPTRYTVFVYQLTISPTKEVTGSVVVGRLITQETQVSVPPGIMSSGNYYYFKFETGYQGGLAPQTLLAFGSPNCGAAAVSGAVTP
jgi:hypothetical protein